MDAARVAIRVVTISATYGAGGSIVGPQVAERLGLPFLDRAIPVRVADALSVPIDDVLSHDDQLRSRFWEAMSFAGSLGAPSDLAGGTGGVASSDRFQVQTEQVIREAAASTGGVILGRAAAIVLGPRPDTLRVRLDGPTPRRVAQAIAISEDTEQEARRRQRDLDRARDSYVRRFYRADPGNPHHYDIVLDSTALSLAACVELVVTAARQGVDRS
jgi:cytidylate kinase